MSESLLSRTKKCYICGALNVEKHHVFFGTAKRRISDIEGCWMWLCPEHHRGSSGVHFDNVYAFRNVRKAGSAFAAGFAVLRVKTVDGTGEYSRRACFARAA